MVMMAVLAACSKGEGDRPSCNGDFVTLATPPKLPQGFPTPEGVSYLSSKQAGPSTTVEAIFIGDLGDVFKGYKDGFDQAGFDITKTDQEQDDAEINFSGANTSGQVKMSVPCEGRVAISVTIRPA
jgi:hypothetical protein